MQIPNVFCFGFLTGLMLASPGGLAAQNGILGTAFPLYASDRDSLIKLDSTGLQTHVATIIPFQTGLGGVAMDASGNVYVATIAYNSIVKVDPTGATSTFASGGILGWPFNLAFDSNGNLYATVLPDPTVNPTANGYVVKMDSQGNQSLYATCTGTTADQIVPYDLAFDKSGNLYVTCLDDSAGLDNSVMKVDATGHASTFLPSTSILAPLTLIVDATNTLYVEGFQNLSTTSLSIYKIGAGGTVSTFSTGGYLQTSSIGEMAFDAGGTLYAVADQFGSSAIAGQIIKVDTSGQQTPFVSGIDYLGGLAFTRATGYTFSGFLAPISGPPAVNTGNAGKTYPIKWQLKNGSGSYVSTLSAIRSITYKSVPCTNLNSTAGTALATTAIGGSSLRYDSTVNQFLYNWATPSQAGCYALTLTLDTGQAYMAYFQLR